MEREERAGGYIGRKDNIFFSGIVGFLVGRERGLTYLCAR